MNIIFLDIDGVLNSTCDGKERKKSVMVDCDVPKIEILESGVS